MSLWNTSDIKTDQTGVGPIGKPINQALILFHDAYLKNKVNRIQSAEIRERVLRRAWACRCMTRSTTGISKAVTHTHTHTHGNYYSCRVKCSPGRFRAIGLRFLLNTLIKSGSASCSDRKPKQGIMTTKHYPQPKKSLLSESFHTWFNCFGLFYSSGVRITADV